MRPVSLLLLVVTSACVSSASQVCSDGRVCPSDTLCDDEHGACVLPQQVKDCEGKPDVTACSYPGVAVGVCDRGVCVPGGCANGILEPTERCEDGNVEGGDGCSADCSSDETCGNGTRDTTLGEQCDDGNDVSHDGCASVCRPEEGDWRDATPRRPSARRSPAMAFDSGRGKLVVFGGGSVLYTNDTWEWDSSNGWSLRRPIHSPPPRSAASMTYDAARRRVVLFGGQFGDIGGANGSDTWVWDGIDWTDVSTDLAPPARAAAGMVYDGARRQVMLHGGQTPLALVDTWLWDGASWTAATPATSPPPRSNAVLAYDPVAGEAVLYGGNVGDTWTWNGTTWTAMSPSPAPSPRPGALFVYDRVGGGLVLYGGSDAETWRWSSGAWTQLSPSSPPPQRAYMGFASDPETGKVYMFGGTVASGDLGELWQWNGSTWTQLPEPTMLSGPSIQNDHSIAYDSTHGELVMFPGDAFGNPVMSRWTGVGWQAITPAQSPPFRNLTVLVDDPAHGGLLAFGGSDGGTVYDDTWRWDGSTWDELSPATSPSPRYAFAMANDSKRGQIVLFGGLDSSGALLGETWVFDGTTWSQRSPASAPSPRSRTRMAYDAARDRIVLFGGLDTTTNPYRGDTWEWDGTTWTEMSPMFSPGPRSGMGFAYDPGRRRVLLFGGAMLQGTSQTSASDTWEWTGTTWKLVASNTVVPRRGRTAMAYDARRAQMVLAYGKDPGQGIDRQDTWVYELGGGQADEACNRGIDTDGDGTIGCADADCWSTCTPQCPPGVTCDPGAAQCGDAMCSALETCRSCPVDCGACAAVCGNTLCEPGESCPGDCP